MIPVNKPPQDVTITGTFGTTVGGQNPFYNLEQTTGTVTESNPIDLWTGQFGATLNGTYFDFSFALNSPRFGNYTWTGGLGLFNGTASLSCLYHNVQLLVNRDCTWTATWDSVTYTLSGPTASPIVILAAGSGSISGTNYAEEANYTEFDKQLIFPINGSVFGRGGTIIEVNCLGQAVAGGSWSDTVEMSGGYSPGDSVLFDVSQNADDTCFCFMDLPLLQGTGSDGVRSIDTIVASFSLSSDVPVVCPSCDETNGYVYSQTYLLIQNHIGSLKIKGENTVVGGQSLRTQWNCQVNDTDFTGFTVVGSNPPLTTCASFREIQVIKFDLLNCIVHRGPPPQPCFFPPGCYPEGIINSCFYTASAGLTWPNTPPCQGTGPNISGPWHWQHTNGSLYETYLDTTNNLFARWANHYWPIDGSDKQGQVASTQDVVSAIIYVANNNFATVLFCRDIAGAYSLWESTSTDRCASWSDPVQYMSNALYPRGAASVQDGSQLRLGLVFDSGSSGPATIVGNYRGRGDIAWGPDVTIKDGSGNPIKVADVTGWGDVTKAAAGNGPWVLHIIAQGDTDQSWWTCNNNIDLTFTKQPS